MNVSEIISALSPAAKRALESMGSNRIGATIPVVSQSVVGELLTLGVIGSLSGLTIKGSAVAEKLQNASLDRIFG